MTEKANKEPQAHCEGTSEGVLRKQVAIDKIKIFYKNESTFTFDKYVIKIKGIFNMLNRYSVPLYGEQMMKHLQDQTMSLNTELKTVVNICRLLHSSTFIKSSTYLSTVVVRLYPKANTS